MADIRIKDLPTTASQTASDDFIALDGTVNGTRKIDASAPSFKTSVTSPSIVAPATTNLTLAGGSTGASLGLVQGANGSVNITSNGTGSVNVNPGASGSVNVNSASGVGKMAVRTGTNENAHFRTATSIGGTGVGLDMLNDANGATVGFTLRASATRLSGGTISVTDTTAASSTTTGALQVAGGVGVGGAGYFGGAGTFGSSFGKVIINQWSDATNYGAITLNGNTTAAGSLGIGGGASGDSNLYLNAPTGGSIQSRINGTAALTIASTGAATFAGAVSVASTTSASSSTVGALTIGNGTAATNVAIGDGYIRAGSAIFANNAGTNTQLALGSVASAATTYSKLRTDGSGGLDISAGSGGALSFGYDNARPVGAYGVWTFNSTTPSTGVGTGALQVAGGIYAGAASVFNGFTSFNGGASIQGSTAAYRYLMFATGATNNGANAGRRYNVGVSTTAESGSNVGSDYEIRAYDDAGSPLRGGPDLLMTRSTGAATFAGTVTAGSGTHTFGNANTTSSLIVSRTTTTPSSVTLGAGASQPNLSFGSDTAGGYTWGRVISNGSEIMRVHNANFAAIANVAGGGVAVGGALSVASTTASTNTTSGALVVTGGVGVGGAINVGGAATFAGAVAIGNTVNTVSPTSPNRTVTMVIGGVTYYLAAKTTND